MMRPRQLVLLLSFLCSAELASAQMVLDPGFLEFTASADHTALDPDGLPVVTRYEFFLYQVGSATPLRTVDLGKPTPNTAGTIRIALSTVLIPLPAGGIEYEVRIAAVGPTGSSSSTPSNTFAYQVPCTYAVTPTSRSFGSSGGSNTFSVTAPIGCAWTAASSSPWITITTGASGTANGTVTISVAANTMATQRSGTLTIAGQSVTVTQSGVPCSFTVAPASRSMTSAGGSSTFSMTAPAGCAWSASTTATWISITGGASGDGNGTVTFTASANPSGLQRTGSLTIGGQTVSVVQAGVTCTFAVSPASATVARAGGTAAFSVTAPVGCTWSASEQSTWISIASGASGTGNGNVTFTVDANMTTSSRSATATIAGQSVTIAQPPLSTTPPAPPTSVRIVQ